MPSFLLHQNNLINLVSLIKVRFLTETKKYLESFESFVNRLNSDNHHLQLEALTSIAKLLSIVEVFNTPQERRSVAEVFLNPPHYYRLDLIEFSFFSFLFYFLRLL
jgi:hypothetical protein